MSAFFVCCVDVGTGEIDTRVYETLPWGFLGPETGIRCYDPNATPGSSSYCSSISAEEAERHAIYTALVMQGFGQYCALPKPEGCVEIRSALDELGKRLRESSNTI